MHGQVTAMQPALAQAPQRLPEYAERELHGKMSCCVQRGYNVPFLHERHRFRNEDRRSMTNVTRAALIQASYDHQPNSSLPAIKQTMIDKHMSLIQQAADRGAQVCCLQELWFGPYFPAEQDTKWYAMAEPVPDGPTTRLMQEVAKRHEMVMVVSLYEQEMTGVYYNTAAIIDQRGQYLGKYRKNHLPHCHPGFWEKFYFKPGNLGYPVWQTDFGRIGIYICYDRHFPEGARELGLNGAEIVFNPSATVAGLSEYLWKLEQPAHAAANQYFIGAINRVGVEQPWETGEYYGTSYFCNPHGQIIAEASRDQDEVLVADLDLDMIQEARNVWQFYRDRRPETYERIARL